MIKKYWAILIVIFFGILAAKGLIGAGYFNMHDDLQMMRQLQIEKCFLTLQIPCRWIPDMGYGFGYPLFNFYPPLPYLFGQIFRIFGVSFVDTAKLTFIFAFVASGVTMYLLSRQFFGKLGGIISSLFYVWAPYHAVDIYVRGAMNEAWALIFFPAVLLSSYKLISHKSGLPLRDNTKNIIFLALSWTGLFLSHNLMVMIFAPIFAVWCLLWIVKHKHLKAIFGLFIAGLLCLGLAAFFTLPIIFEQKLVHTEGLIGGYYEYSSHFVTIKQLLFSRFWGNGPSVWEDGDGMSFQVGILHIIVSSITIGATTLLTLNQLKKRKKIKLDKWVIPVIVFFGVGVVAMFMTHNKSTPLWLNIQTLKFVQFPWRFLTLVIFSFSFISGAIMVILTKPSIKRIVFFVLISLLLISNWSYFNVQGNKLSALSDSEKFAGAAFDLQRTASIYDYLPLTAKTAPKAPMVNFVEIIDGSAEVTNVKLGTHKNSFDINVTNDARIRLGLFDFPDWRVYVDGKHIDTFIPDSEDWGRIYFLIPQGQHRVDVNLHNTPIRNAANIISLFSWLGLIGFVILRTKKAKYIKSR